MSAKVQIKISQGQDAGKVFTFTEDVVPIRKRDASLPKALATVLDRALSKDRKNRPQNAAELLAALRGTLGS